MTPSPADVSDEFYGFDDDDFALEDEDDEHDPAENCGRWRNGKLGSVYWCTMAGTEFCDFECPLRDAPKKAKSTPRKST